MDILGFPEGQLACLLPFASADLTWPFLQNNQWVAWWGLGADGAAVARPALRPGPGGS